MIPRALALALALSASLASSTPSRWDYRSPCSMDNSSILDWDPNLPLYLQWSGTIAIPTGSNLTDDIYLQTAAGVEVPYWAVSPSPGVVILCPEQGLLPDTEYVWRIDQFLNRDPNSLPVMWYPHAGIVNFRTAATSDLPPIGSRRDCLGFDERNFRNRPACTNGPFDRDLDGWSVGQGDCDDAEPSINPDAIELCDGIDNNCRGGIDEGFEIRVWTDADGDGFGDPNTALDISECADNFPSNTVIDRADCDDTDPNIYPGAPELPGNGVDEDCDGADEASTDTGTPAPPSTAHTADTGTDTASLPPSTGDTG